MRPRSSYVKPRMGIACWVLFVAATACSDSGSVTVPEPPKPVPASIRLSQSSATLEDGAAVQLTATVLDQRGQPLGTLGFAWASSDPAVAVVDGNGLVTGIRPGDTQVRASAGGLSASATLSVRGTAAIAGSISFSNNFESVFSTAAAQDATRANQITPNRTGGRSAGKAMAGLFSGASPEPPRDLSGHQGPEFVPGSLIVTFRSAALGAPAIGSRAFLSASTVREVAEDMRAHLNPHAAALDAEISAVTPALLAARIRVDDPARIEEVRAQLLRDPAIASVEREQLSFPVEAVAARSTGPVFPNDPRYAAQAWHYNMIDLPKAWKLTTGSPSVVVAVVDDGTRFDHPALAANLTRDGYDFVSSSRLHLCTGEVVDAAGDGDGPDADPTTPAVTHYRDRQRNCYYTNTRSSVGGHGLHVAGTIGAVGHDRFGVTGVNWNVRIRPVRVLGLNGGSELDIARGILYAAGFPITVESGQTVQATPAARVINLSLGGIGTPSPRQHAAVIAATNAGALIVAAAGNDNGSADQHYPSAFPEVLAVAAVAPDYKRASYSNFGSKVDIAAPGGETRYGPTFGVFSTAWDFAKQQPVYKFSSGTSMAAPHVAGVAALLLAQEPGLTVNQLKARLMDYAIDIGAPGRDNEFGAGLVNARNSLTRTRGPSRAVFARLYDAETGAVLRQVPVANGQYSFTGLARGSYYVLAGADEDGDQQIGLPGRHLGGFTGAAGVLSKIAAERQMTAQAPITLGFPYESEPNNDFANADKLVIGSYVYGYRDSAADEDVFSITVPAGQYTFETSGWLGSCGYANEEDTLLELYRGDGSVIGSNDDIDPSTLNYCSRVTQTLQAGTYFVKVKGLLEDRRGTYRLQVRPGS